MGRLMWLPLFLLSLTVHEFAHGWVASRLGDDTARRMGRLTLNPVSHIDLIGTILLPLLGVPFGWAKPVPVDPTRFRRDVSMARGMALTASAGPLANVVMALLSAVALGLGARAAPSFMEGDGPVVFFLVSMLQLNVGLALFNLIPIPPLDGSRIVAWLMPSGLREQWHQLERFAPLLILAVFWFGGRLVSGPIYAVTNALIRLAQALV
jgi:Zn-dependent protease